MSQQTVSGALRMPLLHERPVATADAGGGFHETWQAEGLIWAKIAPVSAGEAYRYERFTGRVSHRIYLRYNPALKSGQRFVSALRHFRILAVYDPDERRRTSLCLAEEIER